MEKPIAHRVALRMKPATKQQLYVNQSTHKKEVRYCDKEGVARKLFVDQVYDIHSTTLQIFNDLFGKAHWEEMGETLFVLLGGTASGKSFTLVNASSDRKNEGSIEEERGLLFHLMDKIKRQGAARGQQIRCNYRFLEIQASEARNLGFQLAQIEGLLEMGEENYDQQQIQEFSLSPDGSQDLAVILGKISRMRNPKGHLIVQVTIHPQSFRSTQKYTISFVELNASILQQGESGKQILDVISRILQNLTRIRMMIQEKQAAYFEDNTLTRILKHNFLSLRKWLVLGTLDEENMGPAIVCMTWLETLGEVRSDKALVDAQWRQVQRQEGLLKKLVERHKRVMGILSKCIDLQPTQIDRRSLIYLECMPAQDRRGDKLKISNAKKAQNEEEIDILMKDISTVQQQIAAIREGHKKKVEQLELKRQKAQQKRVQVWKSYAELKNPCLRTEGGANPNSSSLFYKPLAIVKPQKQANQTESPPISCLSRAHLQSHKIVTKRQLDLTRNATAIELKRSNMKIQNNENNEKIADMVHRADIIKQKEIKRQINHLSALLVKQESWIERTHSESSHLLSNNVINRIKCSKNGLNLNLPLIKQCLLQDFQNEFAYTDFIRQQQTFHRFQRQLRQKQLAAQTVTTIKDI